jgi:hypothetical protein
MRVEVKFHHRTRDALNRWRQSLGTTERERQEWYDTLIAAMKDEFREHGGFPPQSAPREIDGRTVHYWRFSETLLVQFQVTERLRRPRGWWDVSRIVLRWFCLQVRTVLVTEAFHPPSQS